MPIIRQDDFGGGIWRGSKAPRGHVYDAVNTLVNDEGELFRRGGWTYKSTSDHGSVLNGLWAGDLTPGERVLAWSTSASDLWALSGVSAPVLLSGSAALRGFARPAVIGPYLALGEGYVYAGSLKTGPYSAGTMTTTDGSRTVTGAGTAWLANVDAGMILRYGPFNQSGVVASVVSDTELRLVDPWVGPLAGVAYSLDVIVQDNGNLAPLDAVTNVSYVASAANRLIAGAGNRIAFAGVGAPYGTDVVTGIPSTDYHLLPAGAILTGLEGVGDDLLAFTTDGLFQISNMAYELTDADGNPQHRVDHVNRDLILWADSGLASYRGARVVPALDDVYLFSSGGALPSGGGFQSISEGIRPLYRSYVEAGYRPGLATVYRGHYFLPIMSGTADWIDTLVCRLDGGRAAWTRWEGGSGFARRSGTPTRAAALYAVRSVGQRVLDMTTCFTPANAVKADANGTVFGMNIITNDFLTGSGNVNTVERVRTAYELIDAASDNPTFSVFYSTDEGANWVAAEVLAESAGLVPETSRIGKRARRVRFMLTQQGPARTARLEALDVFVRRSNRP